MNQCNWGGFIVSNMNKRTRDKLYPIIAKRDEEYCRCCGKLPYEVQLIIDHKDNNNSNNTLTNLQLLCRSCNYLKNPRKEPFDMCVNNKVEADSNSCMAINKKKEPEFLEYVKDRITNEDAVNLKDLINSGARKIDISPVTAKRYIEKHSSEGGELMVIDDKVIFSQYYDFSNDPRIIWFHSLKE